MSKVKLDVAGVVLVFPLVSLLHHLAGGSPAGAWTPLCMCPWSLPHYNADWLEGSRSLPWPHCPVSPGRKTSPQAPAMTLALVRAQTGWAFSSFSNFTSLFVFFPFSFFLFYFKFFFYSKSVFIKRCSFPKLPESTDQFPLRKEIWEHLTSLFNKTQRKRDKMTSMRRGTLHFNWWLAWLLCTSSGWIITIFLAWETLKIFLLNGISKKIFSAGRRKRMTLFIATFMISLSLQTLHTNSK